MSRKDGSGRVRMARIASWLVGLTTCLLATGRAYAEPVVSEGNAPTATERPSAASPLLPPDAGRPDQKDQEIAPSKESEGPNHLRSLGAMLDIGFPDGLMVGAAYRPWPWLRAQAGAGWNAVSAGIRGGIVIIPFGTGPSLTLEGGHYFEGDANGIASRIVGSEYENNRAAKQVSYQFVNGHLGVDIGKEYVTFFIHGGISFAHAKLHNVNDAIGGQTNPLEGTSTSVTVNGDPTIRAWFPSFKLGLIINIV
jgi:hypothetical protein